VIALLVADITEAYQKARAAKAGLEYQLGIVADSDSAFPEIKNTDEDVLFLDKLVMWTRSVMSQYEIQCADDVVFDRVLTLTRPRGYTQGEGNEHLLKHATFMKNMTTDKGKTDAFSISVAIPQGFDKVRLRGIGLSTAVNDQTGLQGGLALYASFAALVFPPEEDNLLAPGQFVRSPTVLGRIGPYQLNNAPIMNTGDGIWNIDPRKGKWVVAIEPGVVVGREPGLSWPREMGTAR
jgi:hypothetical protein